MDDWLSVIDGRFLPVDELELSVERDAQNVMSTTRVTAPEIISGTIETRREPALKPRPSQLRLYGPDREWFIYDPVLHGGVGLGLGEAYVVEFEATEWDCRKR